MLRLLSIAVLLPVASLNLAAPAPGQNQVELRKAFDDSLISSINQLVDTYKELDQAGLLANRTIVVLPPLRPAQPDSYQEVNRIKRVSRAGEHLADYLGKRLDDGLQRVGVDARVIYGPAVENRFKGAAISLRLYESQASGLSLGDSLRAGFIIAGTLEYSLNARGDTFVVDLRGQRPDSDGDADWAPGALTISGKGRAGWRALDESDQEKSRVPFAQDPRAADRDLSADELELLMEAALLETLQEASDDFRRYVETEAAKERISPLNAGNIAILPIDRGGGETSGLADELTFALLDSFDASGPSEFANRLEQQARAADDFDMTIGEVLTYGISASAFDQLGVSHLMRTSYTTSRMRTRRGRSGGTLNVSFSAVDRHGHFLSRTFRIDAGSAAPLIKRWMEETSEFAFEPSTLDGERLLRDELRILMPRALTMSGIDLEQRSLRLLPLQTPRTGSMLEAFGVVRGQLARARVNVSERADKAEVGIDAALRSTEFPVTIDVLGGQEFESWETARRTLINMCWANIGLSEPFALGKKLQDDYLVDVSRVTRRLQETPSNLVPVDMELNNVRAKSSGAASDVDLFLQDDPDYLLSARWVDQGTRSSLIARLVDFENPSEVVHLERIELSRAKTAAIRQIVGASGTFSGSDVIKTMLGLGESPARKSSTDTGLVPAEREALADVSVHIRWDGPQGKSLADQIAAELGEFPFDLPAPATSAKSKAWPSLAPKMKARMEIRWSGPAGDDRASAAAHALRTLLSAPEDSWLSPEVRFMSQRLGVSAADVSGPNAFLDVPVAADKPAIVVLIRG